MTRTRRGLLIATLSTIAASCLPDLTSSGPELCNEDGSGGVFCRSYIVGPITDGSAFLFLRGDSIFMSSHVNSDPVASSWTLVGDAIIAVGSDGPTRAIPAQSSIIVRGITAGTGVVTATHRTQSRVRTLRVLDSSAVARVLVYSEAQSVRVGDSVLLGATLLAADNTYIWGRPTTWSTSDSTKATLSIRNTNFGDWLRGHAVGTVTVTAGFRSVSGTRSFTVVP